MPENVKFELTYHLILSRVANKPILFANSQISYVSWFQAATHMYGGASAKIVIVFIIPFLLQIYSCEFAIWLKSSFTDRCIRMAWWIASYLYKLATAWWNVSSKWQTVKKNWYYYKWCVWKCTGTHAALHSQWYQNVCSNGDRL